MKPKEVLVVSATLEALLHTNHTPSCPLGFPCPPACPCPPGPPLVLPPLVCHQACLLLSTLTGCHPGNTLCTPGSSIGIASL